MPTPFMFATTHLKILFCEFISWHIWRKITLFEYVEFANYEQLKQYAKSEFYNKKDDCASSVESIPESETEIKVVNVDDDLLTHQYDELENKITEMSKKIVWLQDIVLLLCKHQNLDTTRELNEYFMHL